MVVKITINDKKLKNIEKNLNKKYVVEVGLIGATASEKAIDEEGKTQDITLAGVGFIQEKGSIINNIPPSSFIKQPLLEHLLEKIQEFNQKLLDLIFKENNLKKAHDVLGIIAENIIRESFVNKGDGTWKSNAKITIEGGWMKNKVTGKPIYIKGKGTDNRLIRTGRLSKSIISKTVIK